MRSKSIFIFLATIFLASCAAPTLQVTATAVPTSTRTATPIPTATQTLKPPSDSEPSWVQNGDELFIFDTASNEWIRVTQDADTDLPVYVANGKSIIIVSDEWLAVTIEVGEDGKATATTQDGQEWVWRLDGWARYEAPSLAPPFSPELVQALEDNGLSVSPDDLCLWEGTEGATVQCLTLNPEAVPELADNLRQMTNTVAWLYTWDDKNELPGSYPTLASYEAMLKRQPLQKAVDVPVIWHPESADIDPTAALWQKASELVGPDGERVGVEALIDMSQVGLELVDCKSVEDEGGWTAMGGGARVKQGLVPVEGQAGVWRLVWRVAIGITKTEALAKYGDVEEIYGWLPSDPTSSLKDNVVSYNQIFNWMKYVFDAAKNDPKTSLNRGKGIIFGKKGIELKPEIMNEMKEGVEYFATGE